MTPVLEVEDPFTNKQISLHLQKSSWSSVKISLVEKEAIKAYLKFKVYLKNSKDEIIFKDVLSFQDDEYTSLDLNRYLTLNITKFMEGTYYKIVIEHIIPQNSDYNGEIAEETVEKLKEDIEKLNNEH
jgi:hypothetical protein